MVQEGATVGLVVGFFLGPLGIVLGSAYRSLYRGNDL
jgi:uncharacterized protein YqgC (DUF456 family)